jgi:hypothetical protein
LNKYLPYILLGLLAVAVIALFVTGSNKRNRRLDERITLRNRDKIPYGTYVAYENLRYMFPRASIYSNRREPGYWDSLSNYGSGQLFISIVGQLNASGEEISKMISFAESGNDVFISARYFSTSADEMFDCISSGYNLSFYSDNDKTDSMRVSLKEGVFGQNSSYKYPGRKFNSYFSSFDTVTTEILGFGEAGRPNFIHLKAGKGNLYLHLEPLAFSNYFLLHDDNISYYEKAFSVVSPDVTRIVWDEYYLFKRSYDSPAEKEKNWLSVLFRYPSLKAALLTAIFTLVVFVLLEMRRKQRYIPVMTRPRNDSLDFVRTIGRLYHDKSDHKDLCRKMGSYFLEHVRTRYKLQTSELDDEFIKNLQFKTGVEEQAIREIVSFIKRLQETSLITQSQLTSFHHQLETFYKKA